MEEFFGKESVNEFDERNVDSPDRTEIGHMMMSLLLLAVPQKKNT